MRRGAYVVALTHAQSYLQFAPENAEALFIAGEAATKLGDHEAAVDYFGQVPEESPKYARAIFNKAELRFHAGFLSESEEGLRLALERSPGLQPCRVRLASLLGMTGRRWEATQHQLLLMKNGYISVEDLVLLGNRERRIDQRAFLMRCRDTAPDDPLPLLGLATIEAAENNSEDAKALLQRVVNQRPDLVAANAMLGQTLLLDGDSNGFLDWQERLTNSVREHPATWAVYGDWWVRRDKPANAARCYWESLRRAPNWSSTCFKLGQVLQSLQRPTEARYYLERAAKIEELAIIVDGLFHNPADVESMRKAALVAVSLGRLWESWGWSQAALGVTPDTTWARRNIEVLTPELSRSPAEVVAGYHPGLKVDLSQYELPDWTAVTLSEGGLPPVTELVGASHIRFVDVAEQAGLEFKYDNADDPDTRGARILETTGGGVGVIDIDRDGFPDLYFTQGGPFPGNGQPSRMDRCFRNIQGATFVDVTSAAGFKATGFGQGVAVGDVNNDGFSDLYIANLGENQLYVNNGDGTFTHQRRPVFSADRSWTTSCIVADLDRDGITDIYDVNYCETDQLSTICEKNGLATTCSPLAFIAAPDRLLLGTPDGQYRDVSEAAGVALRNRYGLGAIAADLNADGSLEIFVANDQVVNTLLTSGASPSDAAQFNDQGLTSGLGFDSDGHPQGCMGIAAGDIDGDQQFDLFVTNFYHEHNVWYRNQGTLMFRDAAREARLYDGGFAMLGFGTQTLDADLDGWLDIVVANGHVDDLRDQGQQYHMRPQLFINDGNGRFREHSGSESGKLFESPRLGRALARIDWNRDGLPEFVISNIGDLATLALNQSDEDMGSISLRLAAVSTQRDAVGATVEAVMDDRTVSRQITAGDGYQCTNEKTVVIGLGESPHADVTVRWPSGDVQGLGKLKTQTCWTVVEGRRPVQHDF